MYDVLRAVKLSAQTSVVDVIGDVRRVFPLKALWKFSSPVVNHGIESIGKARGASRTLEIGVLCKVVSSCSDPRGDDHSNFHDLLS